MRARWRPRCCARRRGSRCWRPAGSRSTCRESTSSRCARCPFPSVDDETSAADAVELFAQRAAAVVDGFTVTAENRANVIGVCRALDGIPLAIELATVRLRALPLDQMASRLDDRFHVLTGGRRAGLPRHQTLRAAIEWSHDLCTPAEQVLWSRLSVFAGSFSIPAAQAVCAGGPLGRAEVLPALIGLVDKSVVLRPAGGRAAVPAARHHARVRCRAARASGERHAVRSTHVAYFLGRAEDFGRP